MIWLTNCSLGTKQQPLPSYYVSRVMKQISKNTENQCWKSLSSNYRSRYNKTKRTLVYVQMQMKEKQRSKNTNSQKIRECDHVLWEGYKSMPRQLHSAWYPNFRIHWLQITMSFILETCHQSVKTLHGSTYLWQWL